MYNIAQLSNEQREAIFNRYVFDYGGSLEIVEKDFWVTLMLDYLFHKSTFKDYFIFKGGTSISKCYNIINRFSEDIDIILRWDLLTNDNPNQERSKTKQDKYNIPNPKARRNNTIAFLCLLLQYRVFRIMP